VIYPTQISTISKELGKRKETSIHHTHTLAAYNKLSQEEETVDVLIELTLASPSTFLVETKLMT